MTILTAHPIENTATVRDDWDAHVSLGFITIAVIRR